jgi:glycerol-3-phosphate dehydrogenase subunit C
MIELENISFDHCLKCTVCTVYCPVAKATPLFPGPKQSGPDAERLRIKNPELVDDSLKYCSNCKRCETACPSDVRIADIIQAAKWTYWRRRTRPRDFLLAHTDLMGFWGTALAGLVNRAAGAGVVRYLLDIFVKIPKERPFPKYSTSTFKRWFRDHGPDPSVHPDQAVYFHGCYVNYQNPGLGRDVVDVLAALGVGVRITNEKCCGVPLIANGYLDRARKHARHNIEGLARAADQAGGPIVTASSTCAYALMYEYPGILRQDNRAIADRIQYLTRFLAPRLADRPDVLKTPVPLKVAYHAPCHLARMGGVVDTVEVLRRIPGLDPRLLHSECCGISGTYGFKKELYPIAQDVGADLKEKILAVKPDLVVTDCETCAWQIEFLTGLRVVHPVTLLAWSVRGGASSPV